LFPFSGSVMYVRRIVTEPVPGGVRLFMEPIRTSTRVEKRDGVYIVDVWGFTAVGEKGDSWFYFYAPEIKIARVLNIEIHDKHGVKCIPKYLVAIPTFPSELRSGIYIVDMPRKLLYMYWLYNILGTLETAYSKLMEEPYNEHNEAITKAILFAYASAIRNYGYRVDNEKTLRTWITSHIGDIDLRYTWYIGEYDRNFRPTYGAYVGPDRVVYVKGGRPIVGYKISNIYEKQLPFMHYIEKLLRGIELVLKDKGNIMTIDIKLPETWVGVKLLPDRALVYVPELGVLTVQ